MSLDSWDSIDTKASPDSFTILVIDDSPFVRAQVKEILRNEVVRIIEANDGEEAWILFETTATIDFILCDINMPKLGGLGFLERLSKKNNGKPPVPVVMLTTENHLDKVLLGKKLGATAWLLKPPVASDLLRVIQKFIHLKSKAS